MKKPYLAIPGPTNVPERVLQAMARQPINHRGPEFVELLMSCTEGLKKVFKTQSPVYIFTSSGTGVMEAAIANCFAPGDKVLILVNGAFGERFLKIAHRHRLNVEQLDFKWGSDIDTSVLESKLREDEHKEIKGVLFQHNETSTGVLNDAEKILGVIKRHGALSIVDSISGLVAAPFYQDEWGADVVLAASQKAFMMLPGLAFISVSEKARRVIQAANFFPRSLYFDILQAEEYFKKGQTPATPAVNLMFGLREALNMILEEGLENCWARHGELMDITREAVEAIGLKLFTDYACASPAVTSVRLDGDLGFTLKETYEDHGVDFASGQGRLKGKIFRIAHLGHVDNMDILKIIWALEFAVHCSRDLSGISMIGSGISATMPEITVSDSRKQNQRR